ncbi:N-acetyl sugar amidotransferase [Amylibacter sp.]|nr:N-acetyl sugar amidotransferase [Amylibacter sp.]
MIVCSRCVMDQTDSKISFDTNGICDHCRTFDKDIAPYWLPSDDGAGFSHIVKKIKKAGEGKEFDCIIGMSGGVDSSYLTYLAKEVLGLRPLVFHVDAGWNSEEAISNIENIIEKLELDLYTEVISWKEMRDLQLAFLKSGVPHIDAPQDHAFFATMYKFAAKYKIKHILTGGNYSTECVRNPKEWMYYQSDDRQLRDIHNKFGEIPLKSFPVTNVIWHKFYLPYFKGIRVYRPLDYMTYNKEKATQLLVKNFNFKRYEQKHFESRFTKFYESYWLAKRFGFDTRKVQFSSLILTGQMKRDEALKNLALPAYNIDKISQDIKFVANKLEITVDELQSYLDSPNKTFKDYKNREFIYKLGAKILKLFRIEKGGKR